MHIKKTVIKVKMENDLDKAYHMACQTACKTSATVSNISYDEE